MGLSTCAAEPVDTERTDVVPSTCAAEPVDTERTDVVVLPSCAVEPELLETMWLQETLLATAIAPLMLQPQPPGGASRP